MSAIFFDLETSDRHPIGQIINYCFILANDDFEPLDECSGVVVISRLQLPCPGAILANRTDVLLHQQTAVDTEREALLKIHRFIEHHAGCMAGKERLPVVGFNSARFDIPYLRTSFIRNGLNPYFSGKILPRDMLFAIKKLAAFHPEFPRPQSISQKRPEGKMSLSLENLSHVFGLLEGAQSHESRADVVLSLDLARLLLRQFGVNCATFDGFEAMRADTKRRKGEVVWSVHPNYDLSSPQRAERVPMMLLDADYRSSLWVDLKRYHEGAGRRSISWFNHNGGHSFFVGDFESLDSDLAKAKEASIKEFSEVSLKNFFATSTCDIEQDIYRIDFDGIDLLHKAIWKNDSEPLKNSSNRDGWILYLRSQIAQFPKDRALPEPLRELLRRYALHRYGGKLQLSKSLWKDEQGNETGEFHPSFKMLQEELATARQAETAGKQDIALLDSLNEFYRQSDIFSLVGAELTA